MAIFAFKKTRGFTLIEMVLVIILLGIIGAIASKITMQGLNGYLNSEYITNANWQGRIALARITRDLHSIRSSNDITTATSSQLSFTTSSGTAITYQLTGSSLMRGSQIMADGVQSLTFNYFNSTGTTTSTLSAIHYIQINLNITQNNANYTLTMAVFLPNTI